MDYPNQHIIIKTHLPKNCLTKQHYLHPLNVRLTKPLDKCFASCTYKQPQSGFTLIEMMVAMVIFSMLTVAGWQVFDTLNRSKDRGQIHAAYLSELQYAYLQLQNDTNQITAWNTAHNEQLLEEQTDETATNDASSDADKTDPTKSDDKAEDGSDSKKADGKKSDDSSDDKDNEAEEVESEEENSPSVPYAVPPFFELNKESLSFLRFLDPDPRYKSSATLGQVSYRVADGKLIRQQSLSITEKGAANTGNENNSSVLLNGITDIRWQALTPDAVAEFSASAAGGNKANNQPPSLTRNVNNTKEIPLLPKGIKISFTYQDMPIEWVFAVPEPTPNFSKN